MKILTSLTYYYPNISGLSLHAQMISEALVKKGYGVSILCMQHKKRLPLQEIINGVTVYRAKPIARISKGFLSWDFIIKSFLLVKKTDVVVIHLPQFEGIFPALFAKLLGKRVIIFYHCDVILPERIINTLIEKLLFFSNFLSLKCADRVLHSTQDFVKSSAILPYFTEKIAYTYPPIRSYKANNRIKKLLIKKTQSYNCYKIGIVSRIAADKGIEYLLEAIPFLNKVKTPLKLNLQREIKILIAGPTDPVGEKVYKRKIVELINKYRSDIILLGTLKDEEMGSFYSILDILVVPSVNSTESFGTVQVEAMMQGTPVVVSDLPGVRVPVKKTGMGIVIPTKDPKKLAEAVVILLKEKYKYVVDKDIIKQEFLFTNTLKTYENAIQNI